MVGTLFNGKRFHAEQFLQRGHYAEYKAYPLPDTPAMRAALKEAYRQKARLFGNGK
jgi:hypothetical protein